jgi:hypothetical protein
MKKRYTNVLAFIVASTLFNLAYGEPSNAISSTMPFTSDVPKDIPNPSDPVQAANFAWREFVALTWPAAPNTSQIAGASPYLRGEPASTSKSGATGAGGVVVWETFYHRDELYPSGGAANPATLPDANALPNYLYSVPIIKANANTNLNLFNNLDEASEIGLATMYYTPLAEKVDALQKKYPSPNKQQMAETASAQIRASLVYEAKANGIIYDYIKTNNFNNPGPRRQARNNAINQIMNNPVSGKVFNFPTGALEVKATYRHYDPEADNLNEYHWTTAITYTKDDAGNLVAHNEKMVLVGLHIIQKTPNVPTFVFATFEHKSNEKNGFRFINTNPQTAQVPSIQRKLPDPGIIAAKRQFPIPDYIATLNTQAQAQLRAQSTPDNVWANYQLIGVQAIVTDNPTSVVPPQQFFLSNFATETNDTLQFFQGGLGGANSNIPGPDTAHVFVLDPTTQKYVAHTSGGCLGCHGSQGQFAGGDFSVIAATGNNFIPEAITPYPGGPVVPQNPQGFPLPHAVPPKP